MTTIDRIRVGFVTPLGGNGLMTFYSTPGGGHQADVKDFMNAIKNFFPIGTVISVPNSGDQLNDNNGVLVGTWTFGSAASFGSTNTAAYAGGVGARVRWTTDGIVGNRRVRGSTFLCPLTIGAYDTAGTIEATAKGQIETEAGLFLAAMAGDLLVWSRPAPGRSGTSHVVTAFDVPDKVSWLRSRRT